MDLSVPEELIITIETLLNAIKERIDLVLRNSKDKNLHSIINERAKNRISNKNPDTNRLIPFPTPFIIIGSKYDIFQVSFINILLIYKLNSLFCCRILILKKRN